MTRRGNNILRNWRRGCWDGEIESWVTEVVIGIVADEDPTEKGLKGVRLEKLEVLVAYGKERSSNMTSLELIILPLGSKHLYRTFYELDYILWRCI